MLKTLKFMQGAVAKKDFIPALTHFHIKDGRITSYNGVLTLNSPIALDIEASPKAVPFIKAIQTCRDNTVVMHMTPAGRLSIKSGSFKAFVDCIDVDDYPSTSPSGERVELNGEFIPAVKKLQPFIADDASRPWARGILFRGNSCYATNNIIIVEYWLNSGFPVEANVPVEAIKELVRIGLEPTHLQVDDRSMTFHFEDGRWLKTQLLNTEWPDLTPVFAAGGEPKPLPANFFASVQDILPFVDEEFIIILSEYGLQTHKDLSIGASVELEGLPDAMFNIKMLLSIEGLAETIDLSLYPSPCIFYGSSLRGAIIGMRDVT